MDASGYLEERNSNTFSLWDKNDLARIGLRVRYYVCNSTVHDSINMRAQASERLIKVKPNKNTIL